MTALPGTNVAATVVPFDDADTFATHDSQYGLGGWHEVASIAERDAIPAERLRDGTMARVVATATYEWVSGAWVLLASTSSLATGHIFVGDSGGSAADVAMSGDATIDHAGAVTVHTVGGVALAAVAFSGAYSDLSGAPVIPTMPTSDNPSATASDTAVNGSSAHFMRADAAPAVQKASASQFGIVKVDGITVTSSGGVITGASTTISGHALAPGGVLNLVAGDVGLGNVTNDAQTKAAIVPNTVPTNGQFIVGLTAGNAFVVRTMSGDATLGPIGVLTLAATAVAAGTYGDSTHYSTFTVDAKGRLTAAAQTALPAVPAAANPTATAGPAAVNGAASTFMRSDASPAIQLGTNAQKGLVQVDGTTITAVAGVITTASVTLNGHTIAPGGTLSLADTDITSTTAGAVLFAHGGVLAEDAALFFWDETNKRLGVGTNAPDAPFTVNANSGATVAPPTGTLHHMVGADNVSSRILFDSYQRGGFLHTRSSGGTRAAPTAVAIGTSFFTFETDGYNGAAYARGGSLQFASAEAWTSTANGTNFTVGLVAPGTLTFQTLINLQGDGRLQISAAYCDKSYSRVVAVTGFAITPANNVGTLILDPAGALAAGVVTMPAAPIDGQQFQFTCTQAIVSLTIQPNTGQTLKAGLAAAAYTANQPMGWTYVTAVTTWYRTHS